MDRLDRISQHPRRAARSQQMTATGTHGIRCSGRPPAAGAVPPRPSPPPPYHFLRAQCAPPATAARFARRAPWGSTLWAATPASRSPCAWPAPSTPPRLWPAPPARACAQVGHQRSGGRSAAPWLLMFACHPQPMCVCHPESCNPNRIASTSLIHLVAIRIIIAARPTFCVQNRHFTT